MPRCHSCGHDNGDDARLCQQCGAALETTAPPPEQRKTVTVLFCDVAGYTERGEQLDPEALRKLQSRYFDDARATLERHGASVEKFIGDAVMAVFGVPQVHEDDALRAARAALELRDAVTGLGLEARIGVNTGEVVTGAGDALVTGDAVNVAARLEQAAQPGEILLGEATLALVTDAAETEPVEPLELKGKAEPVAAHRLLSAGAAAERSHETTFVGRSQELDALGRVWGRVVSGDRCELVTVVADAGVGKSRLIAELLSSIDAPVVRGRCLPYGEGITYGPVIEVLRQLDALPSDPAAAASLRSLLGENQAGTSGEEIAWAFRKLLEEQAPIVVVFDDIQWGEERFLDLIEHVALLSSAPILVLCMARPELLDGRPTWPVLLRLEPLEEADVEQLMPDQLSPGLRERIAHAAGGNPLFITEMLAMTNGVNGDLVVPPTLQAVLAARLDQLDPSERRVLECAAVEGEVFHRGAVQALAPQETQVTARLASLVRRDVVRPDRSPIPDEDGFRFRHLLIRDTAYQALPKGVRAELHVRFAAWLERHREVVELDEILGHHLEQAARYKAELGEPDLELGERAGVHLAAAGRRALWRADESAAAHLLGRSVELIRPVRNDVDLELEFALSFFETDPRRCTEIAAAAGERAREEGDARGEAVALVAAETSKTIYDPDPDEFGRLIESALGLLAEDDHTGLVIVWLGAGWRANFLGSGERWANAAERAVYHSRAAGQRFNDLFGLEGGLFHGPRPADEALRALDDALPENAHPTSLLARAQFLAMLGRLAEARSLADEVVARLIDMEGLDAARPKSDDSVARIAEYEGNYDLAIEQLSRQVTWLESSGKFSFLSTQAATLARWLCLVGRYDEAEKFAQRAREVVDPEDASAQMAWRQAQALIHVGRGDYDEAERLAREAVEVGERTDFLDGQAEARADLAEVLAGAGRMDEAVATMEEALVRYERKGDVVMAARARTRLEELRAGVS